ncbi:MAG: 2-amino-4-hydroxy-6-hydroxymethyldihydropteridine diphosphokinase [Sedimenticola sp.]|nr:MAG: 2-amino-4-hydroxy-6-hydroxymethyldihydropteridine diphosphokinase [Sedimenticola sp.]
MDGLADVYIALGSNLDNPQAHLESALSEIEKTPGIAQVRSSRFYRTTPVGGPPGQADYINAAARMKTNISPELLLKTLQEIEQAHGRVRHVRWGARTLDLDILLYGQRVIDDVDLIIPHPRMHERAFVLIPLLDIAPGDLDIPGKGLLNALVAGISRNGVSEI